ncbi:MAG: hypothetical protein ACREOU_00370 [Candidatus Eiseniibacteriota bacterium]
MVFGWLALFPATSGAQSASAEAESSAVTPQVDLEGMNEQVQVIQTEVDRFRKFKFSGYIQVRWDHFENDADTVRVTGPPLTLTPANNERFYIRRARLKLTYDHSPWSQAVFQIDGGSDRQVRILDVYLSLFDPWTVDHAHQFWAGQMNVPFGYEIERSSSLREFPERSRAENVLFPGERDRGLKIQSRWSNYLDTVVGVYNGGGIGSVDFPTTDPTSGKDLVARVRGSLGFLEAAVSGYTGKALTPLTGEDVITDRTRWGGDAQYYVTVPGVGGASLKGEFYLGHNVNTDSVTALTVGPSASQPSRLLVPGADPSHFATDFSGGYIAVIQNLGEKFQVAARYDAYDPNVDVDHDQFERWNFVVNWFYAGSVRITAAYEIPITERPVSGGGFVDPKDNGWTVQFQATY